MVLRKMSEKSLEALGFFYNLQSGFGIFDPMDIPAGGFHAAEPGHLALGVAADFLEKEGFHLGALQFLLEEERDVFVLETETLEALPADAFFVEAFDFLDKTFPKALLEAEADILQHRAPLRIESQDDVTFVSDLGCACFGHLAENLDDLQGADEAKGILLVDRLGSHGLFGGEVGREFLEGFLAEPFAEFGIRLHAGEGLVLDEGLDPEAGAAGDDRKLSSFQDFLVRFLGIAQEVGDIVVLFRVRDIQEMVRSERLLGFRHFAAADIHAAIDLAAVGRDDLTVVFLGQRNSQIRLAGGSRSEDDDGLGRILFHRYSTLEDSAGCSKLYA